MRNVAVADMGTKNPAAIHAGICKPSLATEGVRA
jgi:hypothetical protein